MQTFILTIIRWGRWWAKRLRAEQNPLILAVYKILLRIGFSRRAPITRIRLWDHTFVLDQDLSMLPSLMNKTYERFELEFVRQTLKSGQVVLDVGANFGLYSVLAAQCVGVSGRVFSFEPMPHTLKHLKENTKAFPQVEIIPFAVGSRAGRVPMQFSSQYAGCAHVSLDKDKSTDSVPLISLDLFLKERGIPAPDFVKIDVEGFEDEVLKGFVECLSPKTILLCELNPATFKRSFKEPGEFLSYLGNRFRRVDFIHETTGQLLKLQSIQDLRGQLIANLVLQL